MKYSTQQVIEVRAKLRLVNSMLVRVTNDLGDLSIDRDLTDTDRAMFAKLSDATCEWSLVIDAFNNGTAKLTKE